jgi:hypothetical protein
MPETLMHVTTAIRAHLSADDKPATYFLPFIANTLLTLCCTTVNPVSSTLNNLLGENLFFPFQIQKKSKKVATFSGVKPFTLANDIA